MINQELPIIPVLTGMFCLIQPSPIQALVQFRTQSNSGPSPIQDLVLFRTQSNSGPSPIQDLVLFRTQSQLLYIPLVTFPTLDYTVILQKYVLKISLAKSIFIIILVNYYLNYLCNFLFYSSFTTGNQGKKSSCRFSEMNIFHKKKF